MDRKTVLVADDDAAIRTVLNQALMRAGFETRITSNVSTLWNWISQGQGDLVVSDVIMPDGDAFDLLPRIKEKRPNLPVIVISAQNTLMTAIKSQEAGATEYLPKPFDLDDLIEAAKRALNTETTSETLTAETGSEIPSMPLVGRSAAMQEIYRVIARLMDTDFPVMLTGEEGTGKSLTARALHDYGKRKGKPFVEAHLSAMSAEGMERELFGDDEKQGLLASADTGTIYIEDIGRLPLSAQTRFTRLLRQGELLRTGSDEAEKLDVRIIVSTLGELETLIKQGLFQKDLFHRLNVIPIHLPPLRKRLEDTGDLARHFAILSETSDKTRKHFDSDALKALRRYTWPGNIRELENLVRRICLLYPQETINAEIVELEIGNSGFEDDKTDIGQANGFDSLRSAATHYISRYLDETENPHMLNEVYQHFLPDFEIPLILEALKITNGNQIKAANILGLNRNTLRKKISEHQIKIVKTAR